MIYRCATMSGFPPEIHTGLLGKHADAWDAAIAAQVDAETAAAAAGTEITGKPVILVERFPTFPQVHKWLRAATVDFSYDRWANWSAVLEDLEHGTSRAEAIFQPSGRIWAFSVLVVPTRVPPANVPSSVTGGFQGRQMT